MCCSFISWKSSLEDVSENNFNSSIVSMCLHQQEKDLQLNSPVVTEKDGLCLFMSFKKFSKLDRNESNSSVLLLGERWIKDTITFLLL